MENDQVETRSEGELQAKNRRKQNRNKSDRDKRAGIAHSGDKHNVEDEKAGESAQQGLQTGSKYKAASRQAKSERRSKKKRKLGETDIAPATVEASIPIEQTSSTINDPDSNPQTSSSTPDSPAATGAKPEAKQRFIVFIGNLPYSSTTGSISSHFSKLLPFTVRHSTDKATGRSRGFAFLEFESYDRMKTCLKVYHHLLFDPSAGGVDEIGEGQQQHQQQQGSSRRKSQARKINVELTAGGGGGKSGVRKERIRGKNEKLGEERERARVQKLKEEGSVVSREKDKTGANVVEIVNEEGDENVLPSRRKRMKS